MEANGTAVTHKIGRYLTAELLPRAKSSVVAVRLWFRKSRLHLKWHPYRAARRYSGDLRLAVQPSYSADRIRVRRYSVLLARAGVLRDRVLALAVITIGCLLFAIPTTIIKIIGSRTAEEYGVAALDTDNVPFIIVGGVLVLLVMYPPLPRAKYFRALFGSRAFLSLWAAIVFISAVILAVVAMPEDPEVALTLFIPCVVLIAIRAVVIMAAYCEDLIATVYPETFPLERLLRARTELVENKRRLTEFHVRTSAAVEIETATRHISRVWPRHLTELSAPGKAWFAVQCQNLATHFVATKRQIMWADPSTTTALEHVDQLIKSFITGSLANLAAKPAPGCIESRRVISWMIIQNVIIALLPLGMLASLRFVGLHLPETALSWATLGAYVWALISLLAQADPLLERRITLSRSLLGLFKS